jgi:hypothetical protein
LVDLTKRIEPGTWRYIGQKLAGIAPSNIPVAGASLKEIHGYLGGRCFQIGQVNPDNAFVVERDTLRLLYVRPDYTSYRRTAQMVFRPCEWKVDFDHALGRHVAKELGYKYVLLLRIIPSINRSHGSYERLAISGGSLPRLCFVDSRIRDKWIGRGPKFWPRSIPSPYDPESKGEHGLTLKQAGWWGYAMGVEDEMRPLDLLRPYSP